MYNLLRFLCVASFMVSLNCLAESKNYVSPEEATYPRTETLNGSWYWSGFSFDWDAMITLDSNSVVSLNIRNSGDKETELEGIRKVLVLERNQTSPFKNTYIGTWTRKDNETTVIDLDSIEIQGTETTRRIDPKISIPVGIMPLEMWHSPEIPRLVSHYGEVTFLLPVESQSSFPFYPIYEEIALWVLKSKANKSSQTIPAKRPLLQDDLHHINHQPTRKSN